MMPPERLQAMTNGMLCYHCHNRIEFDGKDKFYYQISLEHDFRLCSSKGEGAGRGAIMRFHKECWKLIAGEGMCFGKEFENV